MFALTSSGKAMPSAAGEQVARAVHDARFGNGEPSEAISESWRAFDESIASTSAPLSTRAPQSLPMVEQRRGVEDRMLRLAQEARLRDAAEDQRRRHFAACRIEAVAAELDRHVGHAPPLERREQGLKPLRVLVEDGKLRVLGR